MIRNIVFDMGNVLIQWRPERFVGRLNLPEEDRQALLREVFDGPEWPRLDHGTVTMEDAVAAMCRRLPARLHGPARELAEFWWKPAPIPMEGMGDLVRALKDRGYGIYLLSNAGVNLPVYFDLIPGSACFDGRIVSADWKLLKPQREIYETLFREYGLRPEECFFIDDLEANVAGARAAGMEGTVFDGSAEHLRRCLIERGILAED